MRQIVCWTVPLAQCRKEVRDDETKSVFEELAEMLKPFVATANAVAPVPPTRDRSAGQ